MLTNTLLFFYCSSLLAARHDKFPGYNSPGSSELLVPCKNVKIVPNQVHHLAEFKDKVKDKKLQLKIFLLKIKHISLK